MQEIEQGEIKIREFLTVVVSRWRLVAYAACAGFLLACVVALVQSPTYRAASVVQVEEEKPRFVLNPELQSDMQPTVGVAAELQIVQSRLVLEPVIRELGLEATVTEGNENVRILLSEHVAQDPTETFEYSVSLSADGHYKVATSDGEELGTGILGKPFVSEKVRWTLDIQGAAPGETISFEVMPFEEALKNLRESLAIEEVAKQTNILSIAAELPSARLAKEVVDRITQAYLLQNISRKSQEVGQVLRLIEQQLLVVKGDMERDEKELNDLKSARGIFVLSEEAKRVIEQISKMEMSRAETQLEYQQVRDLASRLKHAKDSTAFLLGEASINDELITELSQELTRKLVELRSLRQDFTVQNPRVVMLKGEIDELKSRIHAALNNVQRSLKSKMDTSAELIAKYESQLKSLPQAERELAALTRKSGVTGDLYSFLLKKHEEMRIAQAGIIGNLRVIEEPVVPLLPVAPQKKRIAALGLLAGLLVGVGLAFLAETIDDTVKNSQRLESLYQLPVFGEIPLIAKEDAGDPLVLTGKANSPVLAESIEALATNLRFAGARTGLKRIVFASAEASVGKTTSLLNLGIILANRGAKVLLLDCDLRRPRVHALLGLREEPGITNVTLGERSWRESVVRPRGTKLDILTAGPLPPNQAQLLDGAEFAALLDEVSEQYDYVLLDVPPVLAFTDAAIVSLRADAVFMVVAAGRTRSPALLRALQTLRNVKAPLQGVVFTFSRHRSNAQEMYYQANADTAVPTVWSTVQAYAQHIRNLFLRA